MAENYVSPGGRRVVSPSSSYSRHHNYQPVIAGFVIIGLVMLLVVAVAYYNQLAHRQVIDEALSITPPTPTPTVLIPSFNNDPPRIANPAVTQTLVDYFYRPDYSISYRVAQDSGDNPYAKDFREYTVTRHENLVLLEANEFNTSVLLDFGAGMGYEIDHNKQTIYSSAAALKIALDYYLIMDPKIFEQNVPQEGEEVSGDVTYRLERYPWLTGYFLDNELVYIRDEYWQIINYVLRYTTEVDPDLFVLPQSYQWLN